MTEEMKLDETLECRVRFKDIDGKIVFRETRIVPELFQEIDNKYVYKIEYFKDCGYLTADVTLVSKRHFMFNRRRQTMGYKFNR